jgi:hypothetical protein
MLRKNRAILPMVKRGGGGVGGDADSGRCWPHQPAGWLIIFLSWLPARSQKRAAGGVRIERHADRKREFLKN